MKAVKAQFSSWDKVYLCDGGNLNLKEGEKIIIKTDLGSEIAEVIGFVEIPEGTPAAGEGGGLELKPILRKATLIDREKIINQEKKDKYLAECKKLIDKYELPMKLVDAHLSLDGARITFAFIADGRVDFRDLVKELTRIFNRTIRLQQIGIRDEARIAGSCGHCGRLLCCRSFLREFTSITSEMAELQQCEHRGSDRISGVCGRLMCCLAYEEKGYEDLVKAMPPLGATVDVDGKKGEVVGHHILKRSVDVKFSDEEGKAFTVVEVNLDRNKKK